MLESKIVTNAKMPIVEMENRQNVNAAGTQDSLMMTVFDQRDLTKSSNDIMARRLKNRERQRRYRARKRLEADMKKTSVPNHSIAPQVDLQLNGNLSNCIARVHCKRDWKKDARRASLSKVQEDTLNGGSMIGSLTLTTERQTLALSGNKAVVQASVGREFCPSLSLINCETNKPKLGRRDWKADARNKKS